jgi:hypothetical protein
LQFSLALFFFCISITASMADPASLAVIMRFACVPCARLTCLFSRFISTAPTLKKADS